MKETDRWTPRFADVLKETLCRNRRLRICLILLIGLWIVATTRVVTEKLMYRERNLKEAMAVANPGSTTGTVTFAARLKEAYLTEEDQKNLIRYVAGELGLVLTCEPEGLQDTNREGFVYRKVAKYADTGIKVIGRTEKEGKKIYYLIVSLTLYEDDGEGVVYYRNRITEIAQELNVSEGQTSVQLTGRFPHDMTLTAKNRLADRVLRKLGCETVCENREESLYTIYAYTNGMKEYIVSSGDRINVQLAIYYDEIKDETVLCVASPVISAEVVQTGL